MSVVVRMEMPKNNCEMAVEIKGVGDWCPIAARVCDYYSTKKMPDWCPILCELPENHGRLVDAEEMYKKSEAFCNQCRQGEHDCEKCNYIVAQGYMYKSPTIVPAERSET